MSKDIQFIYPNSNSDKLKQLKKLTKLEFDAKLSNFEKANQAIAYCHNLFPHDGNNEPSSFDPITIIKEAKAGASFTCEDYSFLAVCTLLAYGIKARKIVLKTVDVETRQHSSAHVVIEFWDGDADKWIMSDVQARVLAKSGGVMLSVLELKQAITFNRESVTLQKVDSLQAFESGDKFDGDYLAWLKEYLYYIDTPLAMKLSYSNEDRMNEKLVMLLPQNAKKPKSFQGMFKMNLLYTSDEQVFYQKPV